MGSIRGFEALGALYGLSKEDKVQNEDIHQARESNSKSSKSGNNNINSNNRAGYNNQRGGYNNNRGGFSNNKHGAQVSKTTFEVPTTPYNFVSLGACIIEPPLGAAISNLENEKQLTAEYTDFISHNGKYSGYFDVSIKNITPLYVGSGEDGSFFNNGEDICIPGSSLRGCLKNIFKIITSSAFRSDKENPDITDRHLYFRSFADKYHPIRDEYLARMSAKDEKGRGHSVAQAGFLVREKSNYYIIPAHVDTQKGVYVKLDQDNFVYIGVSANLSDRSSGVRWHNEYVDVFSGWMDGKKAFHRISKPKWDVQLDVPKELVEDYRNDESRNRYNLLTTKDAINGSDIRVISYRDNAYDNIECTQYELRPQKNGPKRPIKCKIKVDRNRYRNEIESQKTRYRKDSRPADNIRFLDKGSKYDRIIPCFYTEDGGVVTGFGATPYFRIPYKKSIGNHIPAALNNSTIDFTDAVFGNKDHWAGRVFFEDLYLEDGSTAKMERPELHKVLAGANPTSFQFYLQSKKGKAAMWDEETNLRGYKLYWHKKEDWVAPPEVKAQMTSVISPLGVNHVFKGRIRFENLDAVELGAMCSLFSLGQEGGICYKLGGGKPIGMGTVKLKGELVLRSDNYYEKLFYADGFAECKSDADIDVFTKQFNEYMTEKLKNAGGSAELVYRNTMEELRLIMSTTNMQKPDWNDRTRYMDINDRNDKDIFKSREPLPNIKEVFNSGAQK